MSKVEPALTEYEWDEVLRNPGRYLHHKSEAERRDAHYMAAVRLYGQPFGFTREDVEMLRTVASNNPRHREDELVLGCSCDLCDLADRIEALLPPEDL